MNIFARKMREERGDKNYYAFSKMIGFSFDSTRLWEKGRVPSILTIKRLARTLNWEADFTTEVLDWAEEERSKRKEKQVKEQKKDYSKLISEFIKAGEASDLSLLELCEVNGFQPSMLYNWRNGNTQPSNKSINIMRSFVNAYETGNPKQWYKFTFSREKTMFNRNTLDDKDYELIREIEASYGQVSNCPDDDKRLKQLHKRLGVK